VRAGGCTYEHGMAAVSISGSFYLSDEKKLLHVFITPTKTRRRRAPSRLKNMKNAMTTRENQHNNDSKQPLERTTAKESCSHGTTNPSLQQPKQERQATKQAVLPPKPFKHQ